MSIVLETFSTSGEVLYVQHSCWATVVQNTTFGGRETNNFKSQVKNLADYLQHARGLVCSTINPLAEFAPVDFVFFATGKAGKEPVATASATVK